MSLMKMKNAMTSVDNTQLSSSLRQKYPTLRRTKILMPVMTRLLRIRIICPEDYWPRTQSCLHPKTMLPKIKIPKMLYLHQPLQHNLDRQQSRLIGHV